MRVKVDRLVAKDAVKLEPMDRTRTLHDRTFLLIHCIQLLHFPATIDILATFCTGIVATFDWTHTLHQTVKL